MASKRARTGGWIHTFYKVVQINSKKANRNSIFKKDLANFFHPNYELGKDWSVDLDWHWESTDYRIYFYNEDLYFMFMLTFKEYCYRDTDVSQKN